jgi:hypothetical protein
MRNILDYVSIMWATIACSTCAGPLTSAGSQRSAATSPRPSSRGLTQALRLVEDNIEETLTYCGSPATST